MRRTLKILLITLLVLFLFTLGIIGLALKFIVTPERLTPIVKKVADNIVTCNYNLDEVDLTFFSTFPNFGLRLRNVCLVNPIPGAPNDTLAVVANAVAVLDIKQLLDSNNLHVKELCLEEVGGTIYVSKNGTDNFSVFNLGNPDTVEIEVTDSTSFSLPFGKIIVDKLTLKTTTLRYKNEQDSMDISVANINMQASVNNLDNILLKGQLIDVRAIIGETQYANGLDIKIAAPLSVNLDSLFFASSNLSLSVNDFNLSANGEIKLLNDIDMDVQLSFANWRISHLLELVPSSFLPSLLQNSDSLQFDCLLSSNAHIYGKLADNIYPIVDATVTIDEGNFWYIDIPNKFRDITLATQAHVDANEKGEMSFAKIKKLAVKSKNSLFTLKGAVDDIFGDMLLDLHLGANANITDFAAFIPQNMQATGHLAGNVDAKIRMSDLQKQRLHKGMFLCDLQLNRLDFAMDSMHINMPTSHLNLRLPNRKSSNPNHRWLTLSLSFDSLTFEQTNTISTQIGQSDVDIEINDILHNSSMLYAGISLQSQKSIALQMDSINGTLLAPSLNANIEYNLQDTNTLPVLALNLDFKDLKAEAFDYKAHLQPSSIAFELGPNKKDKTAPQLHASLTSQSIAAKIGDEINAKTKNISIDAKARYNKKGENLLTQWRPKLQFDMANASINLNSFSQQIKIPSIKFDYSNKECNIAESHIIIGHSDFSLEGNIKNIGRWLQKKDTLIGILNFTSNQTDVNELMALCSAKQGSEDKPSTEENKQQISDSTTQTEPFHEGPFLVPTDVDLTLNTNIKRAKIFKEDVSNLGGRLYIKNGKLVLEEMGFVCKAAKLQLTALYRTPHKDDIYVGFDYHMLDVDIAELISLIPQLDTILPMLSSFRGLAEFHLAGETYVNDKYQIKPSTIRGACSLFGKDLVVLDGQTFSEISRLLRFKKKTENKIDSISAEVTIYKDEIDVYPFCVSMDKYMVAVGGRHNLDMTFNYHVNLLSPLYLGVDVSGNLDDLNIKLAKCVYAKDFKPIFHRKTESEAQAMRQIIRKSMQRNVKIQHEDIRNK